MNTFSSRQVSAITYFTLGVFSDERHTEIAQNIGSGQDGLALELQDYGAMLDNIAVELGDEAFDGVFAYDVCESVAAELFVDMAMSQEGLPSMSEWEEATRKLIDEIINRPAMTP